MALFKDDKEEPEKSKSISEFLFSKDNKGENTQKNKPKSSTLMFGGDYSNNKQSIKQNNNNNGHVKIPMFNDNNNKTNNSNQNKKILPTFDFSHMDTTPYNVVNDEHKKKLVELRETVNYYINQKIFSEELERKSSMSVGTQKNKIVQKTNINNKSKSNNCC